LNALIQLHSRLSVAWNVLGRSAPAKQGFAAKRWVAGIGGARHAAAVFVLMQGLHDR
jgi:hypothetical protein